MWGLGDTFFLEMVGGDWWEAESSLSLSLSLSLGGLWHGCRVYVDISSVRQGGFENFLGLLCNTVGMEGGRVGCGMVEMRVEDGADMR